MLYAFTYRLPGTSLIHAGCASRCLEQPQGDGFLISAFIPHSPLIFIPSMEECDSVGMTEAFVHNGPGNMFPFPQQSTARELHTEEIIEIIRLENEGSLTKAVAARCQVSEASLDVNCLFSNLCDRYPDAFVFLFSTPECGTWIGATPELLLKNQEGFLNTMALAGTRAANSTSSWDDKNTAEQSIVTDYIRNCFYKNGLEPKTNGPVTVQAGPVEHLRTEICAKVPETIDITALLDSLAPTPAVCGMPRELAAEIIARYEQFPRGYYGGFCGPWHDPQDFSLYVILRCARIVSGKICMFAGGGIMPDSVPDSEWNETEAKLSTLSAAFTMNQ